jgi:HSP20 family molecular chaperone IbpA
MTNELSIKDGFLTNPFFNDWLMPDYSKSLAMRTDIKEDGANYVLDIELPGVEKKDIDLSLEDGYLTVKATVNNEKNAEKKYLHKERFYGVASRSYYVGDVLLKNVTASFANGVLSVSFPKEDAKAKDVTHRIEIK